MLAKHKYLGSRGFLEYARSGPKAAQIWHVHVQQNHIRVQRFRLLDRLESITCFPNDAKLRTVL